MVEIFMEAFFIISKLGYKNNLNGSYNLIKYKFMSMILQQLKQFIKNEDTNISTSQDNKCSKK